MMLCECNANCNFYIAQLTAKVEALEKVKNKASTLIDVLGYEIDPIRDLAVAGNLRNALSAYELAEKRNFK